MKIRLNQFKRNPEKYRNLFLKKGFIVIEKALLPKYFKNINKLILNHATRFLLKKNNTNKLDDIRFNKELIKLRKKNKRKFSIFFDKLQTSVDLYQFWTNYEVLNVVQKLLKTNITNITATDFLLRIDSPIDKNNQLEWHQDSSYFRQNNSGFNGINCWAPLTNLKVNMGPLEFLENSHKMGIIKVKKERLGKFKSLQRKLPENTTKNFKINSFELNRGDIIFLNMDIVHRSGHNYSKVFRMTTICRYHNSSSKDFNSGLNIYRYSNKKINKQVHGF